VLVIETPLGGPAGETLAAWLLTIAPTEMRTLIRLCPPRSNGFSSPTYILRRLHSAQACGVVILLDAADPLTLMLSCESIDAFRGVMPWKVWNMPLWAGTGIDGAILCGSGDPEAKSISRVLAAALSRCDGTGEGIVRRLSAYGEEGEATRRGTRRACWT
jgi:hypothetical protein